MMSAYHYIYGDSGNDTIWGEDKTTESYLWGGEGHDRIYGATTIET